MAIISCVLQQNYVKMFDYVDLEYDADYSVAEGKSWWEDVEENLLTDNQLDSMMEVTLSVTGIYTHDQNKMEDGTALNIHAPICRNKARPVTETSKIYVLDTSVYTVWGLEIIWEEVLEEDETRGR